MAFRNPLDDQSYYQSLQPKFTNPLDDEDYFKSLTQDDDGRSLGQIASDTGFNLLSGLIALPESYVGLADLLVQNAPPVKLFKNLSGQEVPTLTKTLADAGVDFAGMRNTISEQYLSPELQAQNQNVSEAFDESFIDGLKSIGDNPGMIGGTIVESVPQMIGVIAATKKVASGIFEKAFKETLETTASRDLAQAAAQQAVKDATPKLTVIGATGEGLYSAGLTAADFAGDGDLTTRESIGAAGAGLATGVFGALGGKLGQRLGIGDIEADLAARGLGGESPGLIRSTVGGAVQEGLFEEMPQSVGEQVASNFGAGEDLTEGLGQAAGVGLFAGAGMGGGFGAVRGIGGRQQGLEPEQLQADFTARQNEINRRIQEGLTSDYVLEQMVNDLNNDFTLASQQFPSFEFTLNIQNAMQDVADQGGDNLEVAGAGAEAAANSAPNLNLDQRSGPASNLGRTLQPDTSVADALILADRDMRSALETGDVDAANDINDDAVQLRLAQQLYQRAAEYESQGEFDLASRLRQRGNAIMQEDAGRRAAFQQQSIQPEPAIEPEPFLALEDRRPPPLEGDVIPAQPIFEDVTSDFESRDPIEEAPLDTFQRRAQERIDSAQPRIPFDPNTYQEPAQSAPDVFYQGSRGDGFATRKGANAALRSRERAEPTFNWEVYEDPNTGRFALAGFRKEAPAPREQESPTVNAQRALRDAEPPAQVDDDVMMSPRRVSDIGEAREQRDLRNYRNDLMEKIDQGVQQRVAITETFQEADAYDGLQVGDTYITTNANGDQFRNKVLGFTASRVGGSDRNPVDGRFPAIAEEDILTGPDGREYKASLRVETINPQGEVMESSANMYRLRELGYEKMGGLRSADQDDVMLSSRRLREGTESLEPLLGDNPRPVTREVAQALQERQRQQFGLIDPKDRTPESEDKISDWMVDEVEFEFENNPETSGVGWYSDKFQRALDQMAKVYPELESQTDQRNLMTALIAITSDGQKVDPNFRMAMEIFGNYRDTGSLTSERSHNRIASIKNNLQEIEALIQEHGVDGMHDFLMQEATVSELKQIAKERGGTLKSDYQASVKMPLAAVVFGPKLGAFYANLMGSQGYLTMDRWWSRTFNRYRGTLLTAPTPQSLRDYAELTGDPSMTDEQVLEAVIQPRNDYESRNFKTELAELVGRSEPTKKVDKDQWMQEAREKAGSSFDELYQKHQVERKANTIYKMAYENMEDAPYNATDRTFMLNAAGKAQQKLAERGQDISVADIQAILWYYEKRLYAEMGAGKTADISYEEVAKKIAEEYDADRPTRSAVSDAGRAEEAVDSGAEQALQSEEELNEPSLSPRREPPQPASVDTALARVRNALRDTEVPDREDAGIKVVLPDSIPTERRDSFTFAAQTARAFQKSGVLNFVEFEQGVTGFNGATVSGQIFIDVNAEQPYHVVLGHELTHVLRRDYADLYQQLEDMIIPQGTAREESARQHGYDMDSRQGREEYVADVVGNRFGESEFWQSMAEANPKGFRRIAQVARSLMQRLADFFRDRSLPVGDAVQDLNRVRSEITKVMSQYKDRLDQDPSGPIPDSQIPEVMFSPVRERTADVGVGTAEGGAVDTQAEPDQTPEPPRTDSFAEENKRIREENVTIVDKIKREARRQLAPGGLLPNSVFEAKIDRDNRLATVEFDTVYYVNKLERAVKKATGKRFESLDPAMRARIQDSLTGNMDKTLPAEVKEAVIGMRQSIDGLSKKYVSLLKDQAVELIQELNSADMALLNAYKTRDDAIIAQAKSAYTGNNLKQSIEKVNQVLSKVDLFTLIENNVGEYVHRSYKAFDDPNWFSKVPDSVLNNARVYLMGRMTESGMSETAARERTEVVLNDILKEGTAYGSMEAFIKESKLGSKDLSILKKRQDIAPEIRALLGQYEDPRINYAKTTAKMARLIYNSRFLDRVKDVGMGEFLFTEDNRPPNMTKIAVDGSKVMEPLNGLYAPREVAQAFSDMGKSDWGPVVEGIIRLNGMVKYGKTVGSPTTQVRNFMSAAFFALFNGHFDLTKTAKSLSVMKEYFTKTGSEGKIAYLRRLKELGVVYDTPYAGEMMRLLEDSKLLDLESQESDGAIRSKVKTGLSLATRFYQFGDDFWKIVGFENEKQNLIDSGMTSVEAEVEAAKRIRNTYPTYSMVGKGINTLRRFPLAGTFVSFPAEIIRTSYNNIKIAAEDIKNPQRRSMGIKRLAGIGIASANMYALQEITKQMFDVSDDEEEAIRLMAPYWQENSNFLFKERDEDGNRRYFDISFLDPYNYFKRPINAAMRDQPWEESFVDAARDMMLPFLGTDILAGSMFEVLANKKSTGAPISREDGLINQLPDFVDHIRKSVQPGVFGNLERIAKAHKEEITSYGKEYKMEDELMALAGWRVTTFNPKTALKFRTYDIKEIRNNASALLNRAITDPNLSGDEGIEDALDNSLKMRERAFTQSLRLIEGARAGGMTDDEIFTTLTAGGISKREAAYLVDGEMPPMSISPTTVKREYRDAIGVLSEEKAEEIFNRYGLAMDMLDERQPN